VTVMERLRALGGAGSPLWRLAPERRLAMLLAATAVLWLLPGSLGSYVGTAALVATVGAVVVDILLLPAPAALSFTREVGGAVGIGDEVDGAYEVVNRSSRAIVVRLYDKVPPQLRGGVGESVVVMLAHDRVQVPFSIVGMARGKAPLGPVGARITTRLGLVALRLRLALTDEIRVIPSVSGVRRFRLLALQHRLDTAGVRALRRKGEGQGFAGLREYVLGDDPRHIDWKATSKKAKVITREYTIERSQTVITLIDAGRAMTQLAGEWTRFELALSSALILTDIAANAGDKVGTLVFDDEVRAYVPAQRSRGALQLVRDALVPVVATTREPDYAAAFRFLAAHQRKRALIVFFTDVIDVRASQALLAHVSRSAARHLALVVALRNDDIFAAAVPQTVGSSALLYENAAAEELIQAREEALERMRRAGAVVLDVSPRVMTASVINRYLELKARGAI